MVITLFLKSPGAPFMRSLIAHEWGWPQDRIAPPPTNSYPIPMEVSLTDDQKAFIKLAVADGRLRSEEEGVAQALALWEERERGRIAFLATLTDASVSLARGEGRELTDESPQELAKSVKERGQARLATELTPSFATLRGIMKSAYKNFGGAEAFHRRESVSWDE